MKYIFDSTAFAVGLVLLAPLFLQLQALILLKHGSSSVFCQTRPWLHG